MILRKLKANSTNIASYTVDDLSKQTELWSNIILCCYLQLHFFTSCCFLENKILNKLRTVCEFVRVATSTSEAEPGIIFLGGE